MFKFHKMQGFLHSVNLVFYMVVSEHHHIFARVWDMMIEYNRGITCLHKLAVYLGRTLQFSASSYLCQEEETGYRGRPHSGEVGKRERRSFLGD